MPNPGSNDSNGPGLVELTSNIGTWVAAGLAIIALVGIVGPLLALQAAASDKNRAMNAVQDQQQKYVSRGFRLTRGLRVFRRIRVPNLSPGYITNEPDTAPLVPSLRAALGRWVLKPRDYLPWNSGWAKFAELIEAYEVRDGTSNGLVELSVPETGGSLEIVNSRTALVVNKHWILLLGLLGRYGERIDKGIVQNTGIRRDLEGERASFGHFRLPRKEATYEEQTTDGNVEKEMKFDGSPGFSTGYDSAPGAREAVWAVRRSAYGAITLEKPPRPIHGITGTIQELGRHKGSWSYLSSISFVPHTASEIFRSGFEKRRETSSLQTLFWLAHGFLPCGRTPEGRQRVISLEIPGPQFEALHHPVDFTDNWPAYSLQESDNIPISVGTGMQCLGIPEPKVLHFLPVDAATNEKRIQQAIESNDAEADGRRRLSVAEDDDETSLSSRSKGLTALGSWVYYSKPWKHHFCAFQRDDLEKALRLILTLNWDDWGFLVQRGQFWTSVLMAVVDILRLEVSHSRFIVTPGLMSHARVFRWQDRQTFNAQRLADHVELDKFLAAYFEKRAILPLRLTLGVLYILDESLRDMTERARSRLYKLDEHGNDIEVIELQDQISRLKKKLEEVEQSYWDATELHQVDAEPQSPDFMLLFNSGGITEDATNSMRLSALALDLETLDKFGIDYTLEVSVHDSLACSYTLNQKHNRRSFIVVDRLMPKWETDILWKHTGTRRKLAKANEALNEAKENDKEQVAGLLKYEYKPQRLHWYFDKSSLTASMSWQLRQSELVMADGTESIWIEEKDMVMIGLWVANRAAMWIGAQDSRPLLKFVEELDTYVYVL